MIYGKHINIVVLFLEMITSRSNFERKMIYKKSIINILSKTQLPSLLYAQMITFGQKRPNKNYSRMGDTFMRSQNHVPKRIVYTIKKPIICFFLNTANKYLIIA